MTAMTVGTFFILGCFFIGTIIGISKLIQKEVDSKVNQQIRTLTNEKENEKHEN